jgi:hypothetical protein
MIVLLSAVIMGLHAQSTVQKPDQVKLMRQLIGTWQAELGKDTIAVTVFKPFGTGLDGYASVVVKGKIISDRRQLFGYDKPTDQFIEAEVTLGSDMELWACWFTKEKFMTGVPYANRLDPTKAIFRVEIEIKSPDSYTQTIFQNGKRISGKIMNRKKD